MYKEISELIKGHENQKLVSYNELDRDELVSFKDLPKCKMNGVLKASFSINGELMQKYSKNDCHVAVISATGLGKTTSYVIPTILSFASQAIKKSMVISDPKGENYRITAKKLRKEGYKVYLLNFRDHRHSEYWNPLTPIYREYQRAFDVTKEIERVTINQRIKYRFQDKIYDTLKEAEKNAQFEKKLMLSEVGNKIDHMANMLITIDDKHDMVWDLGARDILKSFLWAMLEDSKLDESSFERITEDTFSFSTIFKILASFDGMGSNENPLNFDRGYFSRRPHNSKAYLFSRGPFDCAERTRSSYMTTFQSKLAVMKNSTIQTITSCNSFDLNVLLEDKVAIFIDYHDEIKTHYQMISLFVQSAYNFLIENVSRLKTGKLDKPFYFILDEFGNFPPIIDLDTTISACRGRNIFFILIIQSYAQLDNVYGKNVATIIRDNLNIHIFLGSNNPETLEAFKRECGEYTRISPICALKGQGEKLTDISIETIPLIPKSDLAYLKEGECIITEANCPYVLKSKLQRFYRCEEFSNYEKDDVFEYQSKINPYDSKYDYDISKLMSYRTKFNEDW